MPSTFQLATRIAAALGLCALAGVQAAAARPVQVCTFPGSPTHTLDRQVVAAVFKTLGQPYKLVAVDFGESDDPVSGNQMGKALATTCDTFVGVPVSTDVDPNPDAFRVSAPYASAQFVRFQLRHPEAKASQGGLISVAFETPAQIIAVREHDQKLDVENTSEDVVHAVTRGEAAAGIVWYPTLVSYRRQHPKVDFVVENTHSNLSNWQLTFVANHDRGALLDTISGALKRLDRSGQLKRITSPWELSTAAQARTAATHDAPQAHAQQLGLATPMSGSFVRVSTDAAATHTAQFDNTQVGAGDKLYAAECAKCHGDHLQGKTAPALRGSGFQPAKNSTVTKGGLYQYMSTNMPADKPGQLKPQQYADIMAYMLQENGYAPTGKVLTNDDAENDNSPFNSHVK